MFLNVDKTIHKIIPDRDVRIMGKSDRATGKAGGLRQASSIMLPDLFKWVRIVT